jgi:hypothetical protein
MCVDCVLVSPRIAQVDPGDGPPPEVVVTKQKADKGSVKQPIILSFAYLPPLLMKRK